MNGRTRRGSIPIYSAGKQIGGVDFAFDGSESFTSVTELGAQQMASSLMNNLGYVLDLVPPDNDERKTEIAVQMAKDELLRKEAIELTTILAGRTRGVVSPDGIMEMALRIEKFLRGEKS